jgi:hypothetical protein
MIRVFYSIMRLRATPYHNQSFGPEDFQRFENLQTMACLNEIRCGSNDYQARIPALRAGKAAPDDRTHVLSSSAFPSSHAAQGTLSCSGRLGDRDRLARTGGQTQRHAKTAYHHPAAPDQAL